MAKNKKTLEQLVKEVEDLEKTMRLLVKSRGEFENKRSGVKIDTIFNDEFIGEIKGNGKPSILEKMRKNEEDHEDYDRMKKEIDGNGGIGLCEKYRSHKKMMLMQWGMIFFLIYLALGGNFRGITWDTIKENLGITVESKQVEETVNDERLIIIIEDNKGIKE